MLTQFSRTELLLGKEAMDKLKNSRVAVFGIGGVGGYDEKGKPDPYLLTFVYKAGGNKSMDGRRYRQSRRKVHDDGKDGDLCPNAYAGISL